MSEQNISNMQLLDEPIDYNPEAEPSSSAKVSDGTYLMSLGLGKFGVNVKSTGAGKVYVEAHVEGKIIAPGDRFDGFFGSGSLTSLTFDDGTSLLQQLLKRAGNTAPASTPRQLIDAVQTTLGGSPQIRTKLRWEARGKDENGKWQRVKGMKNFPKDSLGNPEPAVEIGGEICEAYPTIFGFVAENSAHS